MRELVDLYAKLIIGTFTFLGPTFTLLIALFSGQLAKAIIKNREQLALIATLDPDNSKALREQIKRGETDRNLLSPKRQAARLVISLFSALAFVGFYYFQRSHFWHLDNQWIRSATILSSLALYWLSLFTLWQVYCIVISAKLEEEEDKRQQRTLLQSINTHA